jgi:ATP-binding cassette, subfamily B, bacterial
MTPQSSKPITFARYRALFGRYILPQWRKAALMAALLLFSIGLQLLEPQILRFFIDSAAEGAPQGPLLRAALLFLGIAAARQVMGALATYLGADVGWSATNVIRRDLARHTVGLDMKFHNSRTPGEMIERIDGDVTALADFFSQFSVRVLGALLLLVGILVALWLEHPLVGAALTSFALLQLLVMSRVREVAVPATWLEREANAKLFGFVEERLAGLEDVRANGGGPHALYRFTSVMREFFRNTRRAWMLRSVIWLTGYGLFIVGMGATIAVGIYLSQRGQITVGTAYLILQYLFMLLTPLDQITQQMQVLQRAAAATLRIDELLETTSDLPDGSEPLPDGALPVRFEEVGFAYPGAEDQPTLTGLSFSLQPGRVLGLLGRTGSGKSTLTRLLFRFYDPTEGRILLGGVDTRDAALRSVRARVGMVTQEVQLFQATLRENLTFFDPEVPDARILEVLSELGLTDWLAGLPQGLDTPIGAGGGNLSAGEAQLLAFARVFLKDPGLVILDEPSSRLDPATEQRLEQALDKLLAGRTAIIIAHRLDTVARADEILILEDGRVLEHGPRAALLRDPPLPLRAPAPPGPRLR